jgi:hypothetical protein
MYQWEFFDLHHDLQPHCLPLDEESHLYLKKKKKQHCEASDLNKTESNQQQKLRRTYITGKLCGKLC